MSMTQFAMVEELAFLVKDNLPCKHLVLTMEEVLVNFLQADDTSSDGILELEPMNSYNRLLLHRLAEIFGFAHESVGEGDDRHLILERCPDTSIPPILVSDILWKYDEPQSLIASHQILRREDASPVSQTNTASIQQTLEERKAAYLVARERIFSMNLENVKEPSEQKPRSVPVVARRMIAHALGQRINTKNQNDLVGDSMKDRVLTGELNAQDKSSETEKSNLMKDSEESSHLRRNPNSRTRNTSSSKAASLHKRNDQTPVDKDSPQFSQDGKQGQSVNKDYMKKEHLGAAKRMFAHALGVHSGKDGSVPRSRSGETNKN
ncbi:SUZ domain [Sesbania bispinosa]|nr:SUZ domain [Sesbania bispinosa]